MFQIFLTALSLASLLPIGLMLTPRAVAPVPVHVPVAVAEVYNATLDWAGLV